MVSVKYGCSNLDNFFVLMPKLVIYSVLMCISYDCVIILCRNENVDNTKIGKHLLILLCKYVLGIYKKLIKPHAAENSGRQRNVNRQWNVKEIRVLVSKLNTDLSYKWIKSIRISTKRKIKYLDQAKGIENYINADNFTYGCQQSIILK